MAHPRMKKLAREIMTRIKADLSSMSSSELMDLADLCEVHWTTLYKWHRGITVNPRLDTLMAVSFELGYTLTLSVRG